VSTQELPPSLGGPDPRARSAFGRVRRRVGVALLVVAAIMTIWSLSRPGRGETRGDAPEGAPRSPPHAAVAEANVPGSAGQVEQAFEREVVKAARLAGVGVAAGGQVAPASAIRARHLAAQQREVAPRA
jgi:hypothetical protein